MAGDSATSAVGKAAQAPARQLAILEDDADDANNDAIDVEPIAEGSRPLVFISYRHGSDQPIVSALKLLLERAIEPSPEVFVASEGGVRPSPLGFKSQIQGAVQRARAFIGVITQASKDREWLYFEAGAAWGLGRLYAPFLVETSAMDLSTTIGDYQATNAHNIDQVRRLLDSIAMEIGAHLGTRFSRKYSSFARSLRSSPAITNAVEGTSVGDRVAEVLSLQSAGKKKEAGELLARLEAEAPTIEERAWLRVQLVISARGTQHESLEGLEQLPEEYTRTPAALLVRSILEDSSETRQSCLRELLEHERASPDMRRTATINLITSLYEVGQVDEAAERLLSGLTSLDRRSRRDAAELWCQHRTSDLPLLRLMIAGWGHRSYSSSNLLNQQFEISLEQGWYSLATYYADSADADKKTGITANDRGRVLEAASLPSLAYCAYHEALDLGVSVARVNIARMLSQSGVAAAGIQLLDQHQGSFEAASPEYPYHTRAALERVVYEEKNRLERVREHGQRLNALLTDLMELALRSRANTPCAKYRINGEHYHVDGKGPNLVLVTQPPPSSTPATGVVAIVAAALSPQPRKIVLRQICSHLAIWEATINERMYIVTLSNERSLVGISLTSLSNDNPELRKVKFEGSDLVH